MLLKSVAKLSSFSVVFLSCLIVKVAIAQMGGDNPTPQSEWLPDSGIQITITNPSSDGAQMWINDALTVSASASDNDKYSNDGVNWYDYSDDVTSGTTSSNYHISWTCTEGSFTDAYGPSTTYLAPNYEAGNDARDVTLTATATDANKGGDTLGVSDGKDAKADRKLKVYQITVSHNQAGQVAGNYGAGGIPAYAGGGKLGWLIPKTPANCEYYGGATELKGAQAGQGPGFFQGVDWGQEKSGLTQHKVNGAWVIDNNPQAGSSHDVVPFGNNVYKDMNANGPIYMWDFPSFNAGLNNNNAIAAPDSYTDYQLDMTFTSYVAKAGPVKVSNDDTWHVSFTLTVANGVWSIVGGHNPN